MAQYYPITAAEMDGFLTNLGFKKLDVAQTPDLAKFHVQETVYSKRVPHKDFPLSLRVYTGIVGTSSRGVGEDAIRCCLMMKAKDGSIVKVSGDKRVHRVVGWRDNLFERIEHWCDELSTERCTKCGSPLVKRKRGDGTPFMGCATYFLHDKPVQNAPQPAQDAPQATIAPTGGLRIETKEQALETLVKFLREKADLNEIARMFSLGCGQKVVVKDGILHSDVFEDGKIRPPC